MEMLTKDQAAKRKVGLLVWIVFTADEDGTAELHSLWSSNELATEMRNGIMARSSRPEAAWVAVEEIDTPR